ncbi:hypothetical protein N0V86_007613 [Didymella sp. IMI 355093]|nr:hypothetical protein N0V86_007613 [Didymella sp. IMI 355093]
MQFQGPGGFPGGVPPPPPPNFSGPFPPPPPNIAAMPNNPYNFNNQWGNFQQGPNLGLNQQQNSGFNQQPNPGGFQNQGYNQNQMQGQGGLPGGRASKRPKYTLPDTDSSSSSSAEEATAHDSQEEWEAVRILEQRGQGFALQYYIEWAGIDPATGKQWAPTWENVKNAGETLRASWKVEQARRAQEKKEVTAAARRGTQQRSARRESPAQATQAGRVRRSRIIESPEPSAPALAEEPPSETRERAAAIASSTTIDLEEAIPDWTSPQVNIDVRGDSFHCGQYEPFSEIPESQPSPTKSPAEGTTLESSQLFASQPAFLASGIVRDTQSSAGDASYIPITQEELESSLYSDSSDESNEDHIIGYSSPTQLKSFTASFNSKASKNSLESLI